VRVRAIGIAAGDCELRALNLPALFRVPIRLAIGWVRPTRIRVLGQQFAGVVAAIGTEVTQFAVVTEDAAQAMKSRISQTAAAS